MEYLYRFKTEEEFLNEFGPHWRNVVSCKWHPDGDMDYLFGLVYPFHDVELNNRCLSNFENWFISPDMLTKNKPNKPSYKPRKIIHEI